MLCCARLLLLATLPVLTGLCRAGAGGEVVVAGTAPQFVEQESRDVTARLGYSVTLPCRVLHLNNKSVSWVRSRDLQILAYEGQVFTADSRVSLSQSSGAHTQTHALTIARLRDSDTGRYECQLNTDPKMSLFFNLSVVDEALARTYVSALGEAVSLSGRRGGAATLGCAAELLPAPRLLPAPALNMRWLHDGLPVPLQGGRGGVSLQTERWPTRVESRLTLAGLRPSDAGVYSCVAAGERADLTLTVLDDVDEYMDGEGLEVVEAMQRDQTAAAAPRCIQTTLLYASLLLAMLQPA